jgi:hypothetical protein
MRALAAVLVAFALTFVALAAAAHDFRPGVLSLVETAPGTFDVAWTPPLDSRGEGSKVDVRYPAGCQLHDRVLNCAGGLSGTIRFEGIHAPSMRIAVEIQRLDGASSEWLVQSDDPTVDPTAAAPRALWGWIRLGITHIYAADHLAFLLGLLLIVGTARRVIATVTAFTVAHSLTLGLSVLGFVHVASAPVEAAIAGSVLLVAREAAVDAPTLTHRAPWLVALLFGLVHGLGFAGALAQVGLPSGSRAGALVGFNVGVEVGQLTVVAAYFSFVALANRRWPSARWLRLTACYAMGAFSSLWLLERVSVIFTGSS